MLGLQGRFTRTRARRARCCFGSRQVVCQTEGARSWVSLSQPVFGVPPPFRSGRGRLEIARRSTFATVFHSMTPWDLLPDSPSQGQRDPVCKAPTADAALGGRRAGARGRRSVRQRDAATRHVNCPRYLAPSRGGRLSRSPVSNPVSERSQRTDDSSRVSRAAQDVLLFYGLRRKARFRRAAAARCPRGAVEEDSCHAYSVESPRSGC